MCVVGGSMEMHEKRIITQKIGEYELDNDDCGFVPLGDLLDCVLDAPDSVSLDEIDSDNYLLNFSYPMGGMVMIVYMKRPETDGEVMTRLFRTAQSEREAKELDKRMFEALKKKHGWE